MQRTIQRARQGKVPKVKETVLADFTVPDELRCTSKNEPFLLYDSESRRNRCLIFSTDANLKKLSECEIGCGDGTFRTIPAMFQQMYSIHGIFGEHTLPFVYVLSSSKSKSVYLGILRTIKELLPGVIKLRRMLTEFESAYMNAFEEVFPGVKITGCLFHHTQCIWRHVQAQGLQAQYNTTLNLSENIRMLMVLSFVPVDDVILAYEELVTSQYFVDNDEILSGLLDYYESTWIGMKKRNGKTRSSPLFDIKIWNCYLSVINDEIRSNNRMEDWHHSFNDLIRVNHANISKFINVLKSQQNIVELKPLQLRTGLLLPEKRRVYQNYNNRLKNIVMSYNADEKLQYLKNIARVLKV
ncbi:uncharacterized protein LOC130676994 [Microplitis mediator]|uniref:uncharacterized protein LOC130676994 n=1 Tax=Microplitis mediator TaxID=375433 RepID=UPI002553C594|nr:uncharacterized protein LOC130676994 [Microplitis mediator]